MKRGICINCGRDFVKSVRHKKQNYCKRLECRRAKRSAWQREKLRRDSEYRVNQLLSNRKWKESNSDYWKKYRGRNPEKTERNRMLQRLRNKERTKRKSGIKMDVIAKMDSSIFVKPAKFRVMGRYWLIPVIAKMDSSMVNIVEITSSYS